MYTGNYLLADVPVRVVSIYDEVHKMCAGYATQQSPLIEIEISEEDIVNEGKWSDEQRKLEKLPEYHFPDSYLETLAVYRKLAESLLAHRCILMHGSVIAVDGEGYLFTALSGTGKSTHVALWRKLFGQRAVMINDDKPLIRLTSTDDNQKQAIVYGTPWDGKHHLSTNTSVPLKAIVYLQRGAENEIHKVSAQEIFPILMQQTHHPADAVSTMQFLQLLSDLTQSVGFYSLHCNMNPDAAQVAYDGMCNLGH